MILLHAHATWTREAAGFARKVENCFAILAPGCDVKLEGEDDVVGVADLADETSLSAEVAVEDVVGGALQQCEQVGCILFLDNLFQVRHTVQMTGLQQVCSLLHLGLQRLPGSTAAGEQVVP